MQFINWHTVATTLAAMPSKKKVGKHTANRVVTIDALKRLSHAERRNLARIAEAALCQGK